MADTQSPPIIFTAQDALIAIMIAQSASDEDMTAIELVSINRIVEYLPVFIGYDTDRIRTVAQVVFDLFEEEDGLDALFGLIGPALPGELSETAYALACDVAASDGELHEPEIRLLEEIRYALNIDRLHAAAIERGARARHLPMPAS
ncbi:tellurite resistance TerB family protein [Oceanomicrobium pacificus]|uniref:2-dehydro-3-deoxyphosphooctonate aldolase n=1 Tax=Oceanomicrobium pacificus TaxID=2692916 RepID=A0A6B0TJJ7_9RHOB|nr:tellurite resistance TerB family protein [Oceanomicrobium pacificus]MXU64607.1 2-dehydro-3-deoxyphosphooctonate aldolase [Oceanomicrobium pacificus]